MSNIANKSNELAFWSAVDQSSTEHNKLRPYQEDAKKAVLKAINTLHIMDLVVMPTGSGKSRLISSIAESLSHKRVLILTPRCKLLKQTSQVLGRHGILSGALGNELGNNHGLVLATIQTAIQRNDLIAPDVILIDEVHFISDTGLYAQFLRQYPNAKVIGFTATPYRENQHLVKGIYGSPNYLPWKVLYQKDMIELIDDGYLVAPQSMSTSAQDLFSSNYLPTRLLVTRHNIAHLVNSLKKNGRRRCIVFCEDIEHAEATAKLIKETGQSSVFVVHSGMSVKAQEFAYQQFEYAQSASWLVNVGLVSVGVDIPCTDAIAIMRDVGSLALLIQMIGRGLRPFGVKVSCLVYDFGNGTSRFGFIDAPRLQGAKESGQNSVEGKHVFKTCPKCDALSPPAVKTCKNCGHAFDQFVKINAEAKSVQLLSSSVRNAPSHFTDHLFVSYGGATQTQQTNGTWLITHKLFDQSRELYALEATSSTKADPKKYELGHQVLVRRGPGAYVEIVPQRKSNHGSQTSSRRKVMSVQGTRMAV